MTRRFVALSVVAAMLFLAGIAINLASDIVQAPMQAVLGPHYEVAVLIVCLLSATATGFLAFRQFRQDQQKKDAMIAILSQTPVIHGFGEVWLKVRNVIGMPATAEDIEKGAELVFQKFRSGFIIAVTGQYDDSCDGTYIFIADKRECHWIKKALPAFETQLLDRSFNKSGIVIDKRFAGYYWRLTSLQIQKRLGMPEELAYSSFGAYQRFEHGLMLWVEKGNDIYVIESQDSNPVSKWSVFRNVRWWDFRPNRSSSKWHRSPRS